MVMDGGTIASILFFICIFGLMILWPINNWAKERKFQLDRRRAIEAQMKQDIIDQATQKKVADKILRERGKRP
jgi:hypothetical protein